MVKKIEVGGFTISDDQKRLVKTVLNSGRLTYGPMTQTFEKKWADLHEVKYALFCNSGTSALQVALHALKEKYHWADGDEVIIPAVTFVATMNIVLQNNLKPVFVDAEPMFYNIDPNLIEAAITKKTRAIIAVHLLGHPAQMDKIMRIARKHKLRVIEDSCETVGASWKGRKVGSWGDVACFSTYASHLVVTGVGGFACTNDSDLAIRIKGLYNHGRDGIYHSIDSDDEVKMIQSRFNFIHSGYSYRATEMEAALGVGHLKTFKEEFKQRNKNAEFLTKELLTLEEMGKLQLPYVDKKATHSFMLYPVVVKGKERDKLINFLEDEGIMTRFMMPLLSQPIVRELFGNLLPKFPVANYLDKHAFLIGVHPELTQADLKKIVKKFYQFYYD